MLRPSRVAREADKGFTEHRYWTGLVYKDGTRERKIKKEEKGLREVLAMVARETWWVPESAYLMRFPERDVGK